MFKNILNALAGNPYERELARYREIIDEINALEPAMQARSDDELRALTESFRERVAAEVSGIEDGDERYEREQEALDDILPEAFAAVREASMRTIGLRHYDVQLIGGIVLHEGKIAEMRTGEGKTLVASLPLYLNALTGRGAHLVTVNDYLARRDGGWMGPIFNLLGLSVGVIGKERYSAVFDPGYVDPGGDLEDERLVHWRATLRKECYQADVTYGTSSEFGFDYLRDHTSTDPARVVQREHVYVIVDEVDSVLIDGARTPLIISGPAGQASDTYRRFAEIVEQVRLRRNTTDLEFEEPDGDYELDERTQTVSLTDRGIEKIERALPEIDTEAGQSIYDPQFFELVHYLENAIKAKYNFQRDKDYIVQDGRVILVDQTTGRPMPSRRYSEGLHQAIEAKEGVHVRREDVTIATITVQNYFRMYEKLAGMTGTAVTQAEEFDEVYELDVIAIPTNVEYRASSGELQDAKERVGEVMPTMATWDYDESVQIVVYDDPNTERRPDFFRRVDFPDQVFQSVNGKVEAVAGEIAEVIHAGRPVLVGTGSVEASEVLSQRLRQMGVAHEVLNAKNHQREALIVAQAGRSAAVTISTSMAGRGTDILLGGNPEGLAAKHLADKLFDTPAFQQVVADVVEGNLDAAKEKARSSRAMEPALVDWIVAAQQELTRKAEVEDILGAVVEEVREDPAYRDIPFETLVKLTQQIDLSNIDAKRMERAREMAEADGLPLSVIPDLQYRLNEYRSLGGLMGQAGLVDTLTRRLFERHYNARAALVRAVLGGDMDEARRITAAVPALPESLIDDILAIRQECAANRQTVWQAGGLHVIGTERHEARRIDDQLRGRAARQGDPGSSRFYLSLEDELMMRFGGDRTKRIMERLNIPDDMPISAGILSNVIEQAQARFESYNFDIRKNLVEYDEAVNRQRQIVYDERTAILLGDVSELDELVRNFMARSLERVIERIGDNYEDWAMEQIETSLTDFSNIETGEVNARGVLQRALTLFPRPPQDELEALLAITSGEDLTETLHERVLDAIDEGYHLRMLYAEIARIVPLWPVLPEPGAQGSEGWAGFTAQLEANIARYTQFLPEPERHAELWEPLAEALEKARLEYVAAMGRGTQVAEAQTRLQGQISAAVEEVYLTLLDDLSIEELVEALLARVDELLQVARLEPARGGDGADGNGTTPTPEGVREVERRLYAIGAEELTSYERALMLSVIDAEWRQYLTAIDDLRQGVSLEAFGQRDPKVQFKRRAFEMFDKLREDVEEGVSRGFFAQLPRHRQIVENQKRQEKLLDNLSQLGYRVERKVSRDKAGRVQVSQTIHKDLWSNVGRNDPCPCGSGKKFKDCHYREIQQQQQTVNPDDVVRNSGGRRRGRRR